MRASLARLLGAAVPPGAAVLLGAAVAPAIFLVPAQALGHGRFPQAGTVVVDPGNSDRIFVRTTYGATFTTDHGESWLWICPESMGFNADKEDPPVVIMSNGSIVVGTFGGLEVSHDWGCDFDYPGPDLQDRFFVDVQTEPGESSAIAVSSNGVDSFTFDVNLWRTTDDGATWAHHGGQAPLDFLALSLGIAPSDTNRLYLTGRDGLSEAELAGSVLRSDDNGETWQRFEVPGTTSPGEDLQVLPYMGGIDPDDPDTVYIGVITTDTSLNVVTHFELLVSTDGAASWTSVYSADEEVAGFALSPDGATVAIGGPQIGLLTTPADALNFTEVNGLRVLCLTWVDSGLFACADQFVDGYTLGVSTDDGATFTPLAELDSPCGPPECGADTSTGEECPGRWPQEQAELNAYTCEAGAGGAGGAPPPDSSGSCGCRVYGAPMERETPRKSGVSHALIALAAALAAVGLRRRRRR